VAFSLSFEISAHSVDHSIFGALAYILRGETTVAYTGDFRLYGKKEPGEDITWAIEQIDPDHIIPIHTEARDWFAKSFENVVLVKEGEQYNL
jgi:mRNA degradation ribonuclease J1/J2